ncbi:hypothetical protein ruthe_02175 [Rubellimicrobium thermophilum DSM 16684]|uniref:Sulfotransferase family n=1 Tax=Rubellimicrobium thermophilum DSM 16684 TaxID=1123069 RepID=S9S2S6_9RHOB|nr:hypothetical protein [Rubellimicrobium thermophilum]EPX84495.1 hypothetical protein ruthe_02175 [Rubellimicrobium thermophilum DSM 16684]
MLIIDRKIVIVHLRKAGGTSFCRGLIDLLPPRRVEFYGYTREGEARSQAGARAGGLWKHAKAREILALTGLRKDRTRVYLVSLRPYPERVASFYFYCQRHHRKNSAKYPWIDGMSFSAYLRSPYVNEDTVPDFALGADGALLVDEFVPYDRLEQTYRDLCAELGFPNQSLPRLNANPDQEQDYLSCYSAEDMTVLRKRFAAEEEFLRRLRAEGRLHRAAPDPSPAT